jgi:hypothetical protein
MPIGYKKQAFTLQEKLDKAFQLTYSIKDAGDAEFLRGFLIELVEKAFKKMREERHGADYESYPLTSDEVIIASELNKLKNI